MGEPSQSAITAFNEATICDLLTTFAADTYHADKENKKNPCIDAVILLMEKDYKVVKLPNDSGKLSFQYPNIIPIMESSRHVTTIYENKENDIPSLDSNELLDMCEKAKFARCRQRFPVPVILFRGQHICRSATLASVPEMCYRGKYSLMGTAFLRALTEFLWPSEESAPELPSEDAGKYESKLPEYCDIIRNADLKLLKALNVYNIVDIMVEKRKVKHGLYVSASEKVDRERYKDFRLMSLPYPGCEFFVNFHNNLLKPESLYYDWSDPSNDAELTIPNDQQKCLNIRWDRYKYWDLVYMTQNYLKYLIRRLQDDNCGLLLHCISGWDRTPLFISLLRVSLWADGLIHESLNEYEILYFTLAYDWYLFGHHLSNRMVKNEEIMAFCFEMLKFITGEEFSGKPSKKRLSDETSNSSPSPLTVEELVEPRDKLFPSTSEHKNSSSAGSSVNTDESVVSSQASSSGSEKSSYVARTSTKFSSGFGLGERNSKTNDQVLGVKIQNTAATDIPSTSSGGEPKEQTSGAIKRVCSSSEDMSVTDVSSCSPFEELNLVEVGDIRNLNVSSLIAPVINSYKRSSRELLENVSQTKYPRVLSPAPENNDRSNFLEVATTSHKRTLDEIMSDEQRPSKMHLMQFSASVYDPMNSYPIILKKVADFFNQLPHQDVPVSQGTSCILFTQLPEATEANPAPRHIASTIETSDDTNAIEDTINKILEAVEDKIENNKASTYSEEPIVISSESSNDSTTTENTNDKLPTILNMTSSGIHNPIEDQSVIEISSESSNEEVQIMEQQQIHSNILNEEPIYISSDSSDEFVSIEDIELIRRNSASLNILQPRVKFYRKSSNTCAADIQRLSTKSSEVFNQTSSGSSDDIVAIEGQGLTNWKNSLPMQYLRPYMKFYERPSKARADAFKSRSALQMVIDDETLRSTNEGSSDDSDTELESTDNVERSNNKGASDNSDTKLESTDNVERSNNKGLSDNSDRKLESTDNVERSAIVEDLTSDVKLNSPADTLGANTTYLAGMKSLPVTIGSPCSRQRSSSSGSTSSNVSGNWVFINECGSVEQDQAVKPLRQYKLEKVRTLFMSSYQKTVKTDAYGPQKSIVEDLVLYISSLLVNSSNVAGQQESPEPHAEYMFDDIKLTELFADSIGDIENTFEIITMSKQESTQDLPVTTLHSDKIDTRSTMKKDTRSTMKKDTELHLPLCKIADEEDDEEVDINIINLIADAMKDFNEDVFESHEGLIGSSQILADVEDIKEGDMKEDRDNKEGALKEMIKSRQQKLEKVRALFTSSYYGSLKNTFTKPSAGIIEDLVLYISNLLGNTGGSSP